MLHREHSNACYFQFEEASFDGAPCTALRNRTLPLHVEKVRFAVEASLDLKKKRSRYVSSINSSLSRFKPQADRAPEKNDYDLNRRRLLAWFRIASTPDINHHDLDQGRRRLVP